MNDPSIDELFAQALSGQRDDDEPNRAVTRLHFSQSRDVLERAIELTQSESPYHRTRGADILGQLGVETGRASILFVKERREALLALLRGELDPMPLSSAICALGHMEDSDLFRAIAPYCNHPHEDVRWHVAASIGRGDPSDVVGPLIQLMRDADPEIRDWATFSLGSISMADSPEIRDALLTRIEDPHYDARAEAFVGLATRGDQRIIDPLIHELRQAGYGVLMSEAAERLLGDPPGAAEWTDDEYIANLQKLKEGKPTWV